MWVLINRIGQHAALVKADIARRCADQAGYGVPLHVFRHVEAHELNTHDIGQLLGRLGLADAGRTAEQVGADRLLWLAQACTGSLTALARASSALILAEHRAFQLLFQIGQNGLVVLADGFRGNARDFRDDILDVLHVMVFLRLASGKQHLRGADFVNHINCLVRQLPVIDVSGRQLDR